MSAGRLLPLRTTPDGWAVLRIHYSAVPDYSYEAACQGLSEEGRRQELEIDWTASKHRRVYPEFGLVHEAAEALPFDPRLPLTCGWDFGGSPVTGTPAFVPTQIASTGQWFIYPPLVPPPDETWGIYDFALAARKWLIDRFCKPHGLPLEKLRVSHFGDPAGRARPPRSKAVSDDKIELRSCYEIIERGVQVVTGYDERGVAILEDRPGVGWRVEKGKVSIADRLETVRSRLTLNLRGGVPALMVDPEATCILEGFKGAYHYAQRLDGTYETEPAKNWWSHPMDALGYAATGLFEPAPKSPDDDDEDEPRPDEWRSHASDIARS